MKKKIENKKKKVKIREININIQVRIIIVVQLLLLAWQFYPAPSTNGDNAKYYLLGKALIEGKGYRQIYLPHNPVETQYPIIFPMFLGFTQIFSDSILSAKIMVAIIGTLVTLLCFYTFKKYLLYLLFPFLILTASSAFLAEFSVILLSEIPYLFLSLLALFLLEKSLENPNNHFLFWTAILVSVLPVHCRSIGVAFSAAWIITNLYMKRFRYVFTHILILILTILLYRSLTSWGSPYMLQLFQKNSYDPEMGYVNIGELFERVIGNVKKYSSTIIRGSLIPFYRSFPPTAGKLLSTICVVLILLGWIRGLFIELRFLSIYTFFYFGILTLWQTQWSGERFLIGILPFLFLFLILGTDTILMLYDPKYRRSFFALIKPLKVPLTNTISKGKNIIIWILICSIFLFNFQYHINNSREKKKLGQDWKNFYSCADWIRINTLKDAVVMNRKPELFYIRSKRKSLIYPLTHDVDKIITSMENNNVTHVIYDNFYWTKTTAKYLYPVVINNPDRFKIVYFLRYPDTYIMEFVKK